MQKFLSKSIEHVRKIFPSIYESRVKGHSYHFSIALSRSKIITVGLNRADRMDSRTLKMARRLGIEERIKFPYLHSEQDMIGKLIGMNKLSSSLNVVVLRMNRFGMLGESRPCPSCQEILSAYGLNRIWFSNRNGEIESF